MNPEYSIIPQPHTKPLRFMLVVNDRIIAKSLLRSDARKIIAALETAKAVPDIYTTRFNALVSSGL